MTLQEIQTAISARFDQSGSTISSNTTEWSRRLTLINQAEDTVRGFLRGQWSFLLTSATLSTTANQGYINLPSDYERGSLAVANSGLLTINEIFYKFKGYIDTLNYLATDYAVWIKGNNSQGFKLYIQPTPGAVYSVPINYYTNQMATDEDGIDLKKLTNPTDITKIPDPYYIVDWVVGELFLIDDETSSKWQFYKQSAQNRLTEMAASDGRDQNEQFTIKVGDEEDGFDIFNSNGNED